MSRILLVEDDQFNRTIIEDTFTFDEIPADLFVAECGEDAIRSAVESPPDLILLGIRLPGIDGLETVRRLKQIPTTRDIPVWALTANAMKGDDELALQAGFCRYITKPINVKSLADELRQFVAGLKFVTGVQYEKSADC